MSPRFPFLKVWCTNVNILVDKRQTKKKRGGGENCLLKFCFPDLMVNQKLLAIKSSQEYKLMLLGSSTISKLVYIYCIYTELCLNFSLIGDVYYHANLGSP